MISFYCLFELNLRKINKTYLLSIAYAGTFVMQVRESCPKIPGFLLEISNTCIILVNIEGIKETNMYRTQELRNVTS